MTFAELCPLIAVNTVARRKLNPTQRATHAEPAAGCNLSHST